MISIRCDSALFSQYAQSIAANLADETHSTSSSFKHIFRLLSILEERIYTLVYFESTTSEGGVYEQTNSKSTPVWSVSWTISFPKTEATRKKTEHIWPARLAGWDPARYGRVGADAGTVWSADDGSDRESPGDCCVDGNLACAPASTH